MTFAQQGWIARTVFAVVCLAGSLAARADILYLTDGTWVRGTIVKETDDAIEFDGTTNTGITFRGPINRARITSIVRTDAPLEEPKKDETKKDDSKPGGEAPIKETDKPATPDTGKPSGPDKGIEKAKEPAGDFLTIPLNGTFGEDIFPKGVETALDWAIKKKVKQIVFTIDSPGGQVWAAESIRDMIKAREDKITCHIVIKNAISASIWVAFMCDKIAILPGGTFGGAVAFSINSTGNAEVNEKMNSIIASKLATDAERKGHSGQLVKAMILTKESLYAVRKGGDPWELVRDKPDQADGTVVETLSDGTRVVTLTTEQVNKYGIGTKISKNEDTAIAEWLGDPNFKGCGNTGEQHMKSAVAGTMAVVKKINNWVEGVLKADELMRKAIKKDDIGMAIRAVEDYQTQLKRVGALRNQAKEMGMLAYPALSRIDVEAGIKESDELLSELQAARRKREGR